MKLTALYFLITLLIMSACSSMDDLYETERAIALKNSLQTSFNSTISLDSLTRLPFPVRNHIIKCGFEGLAMMNNAEIIWKESYIRLHPDKEWEPLKTKQFNTIQPLTRISYMEFLDMPVAGRDYYRHGEGEMKGKLLNLFTVIKGRGKEVSSSSLITIFSESLFIPSIALQNYITWEEIDSTKAKATLRHGDHQVSGIFYFEHDGLFSRFETSDRYYSNGKNKFERTPFSATVSSYITENDIVYPRDIRITWHLAEGDYDYFKGTLDTVIYNIKE